MNYLLMILILLLLVFYYVISIGFKTKLNKINIFLFIIIYFIFLIMILFNRDKYETSLFSDGTYIKKWIKLIFTNQTVFINIVGNIIIFIPFGCVLNIYKRNFLVSMIIAIAVIIIIETIQYYTKRGIFDLLDISLNMLGSILGYILNENILKIKFILKRNRGEQYE